MSEDSWVANFFEDKGLGLTAIGVCSDCGFSGLVVHGTR